MLQLHRRHKVSCSHRSQTYRRCSCPIYVKGRLGQDYIRESMNQTNWDAATRIVNEWTKLGKIGRTGDDEGVTVEKAVTAYMADLNSRNLADSTVYQRGLLLTDRLLPFCTRQAVVFLKGVDLNLMTMFRSEWPGNALTKSKAQERLKSFFQWCVARKMIEENPVAELMEIQTTQTPTLPFSQDEMARILAACEHWWKPSRDTITALVLLLRWTGLRINDAVTMERSRLSGNKIFLYTQKTGTPVHVPVPSEVVGALQKLKARNQYFFWAGKGQKFSAACSFQFALRKLFTRAGIENGHPHRFRDTFACELLMAGVDMADVSILLGHHSIRITEKHYAPWVSARQSRLEHGVQKSWAPVPESVPPIAGTPGLPQTQAPVADSPFAQHRARFGNVAG